ncbi:MAG: YceD family protein [Pseudomonadota bacterium]
MSSQTVIDGLEFARNGEALRGKIAVADMARLGEALFDDAGEVEYRLDGELNADGKPLLHLSVTGDLHLACQRCLGLLPYQLDIGHDLILASSEAELEELSDDTDEADAILGSRAMDVVALVEDEIILSLPLAAKHEEGKCDTQGKGEAGKALPFTALAALKKH